MKKWLAKQQQKEAEATYKLPKPEIRPPKQYRLRKIKEYIDEQQGNVFIRDVQAHLEHNAMGRVPESTLGHWIKVHLGYTYKKASTISPDLSKVEFLSHQVQVAEAVKEATVFGFEFIYIDETAFTRNGGKTYGFAPKGQRLEFITHKAGYSIGGIVAISQHKVEAFQLRDGKTNKHAFVHFIISLLSKI